MPRENPNINTVVQYLPADGTAITYDAWKDAIKADHPASMVQATLTAKRDGRVVFENARDANNKLIPMVRRA